MSEAAVGMKRKRRSATGKAHLVSPGVIVVLAAALLCTADSARAQDQESELAKKVQNPVADLISLPFQNNTNFGVGPDDRTQNILNIQPVIPVNLAGIGLPDWNLINRTIMPLVYQPTGSTGGEFGLGDINHTFFLSPAKPGAFTWGAGPLVSLPTSVNDRVGPGKLSFGPSAVVLAMPGKWVIGALVSNQWSVAGDSDTPNVNSFLLQYFVNYNLPNGWYLSSNPIVTSNWKADSGDRWTVPIGGGVGKIFRLGMQPMNLGVRGFWNAEKPKGGPEATLQIQLQLMFPKPAPAPAQAAP